MPSAPSPGRPAPVKPVKRVGLFGGAFDPPHRAHRALVEAALDSLHLDLLHIVPTGRAWHKTRALSAAEHRLAMCELAFGDQARVRVDPREIRRPGDSYTVDTLGELAQLYPDAELFLIIGEDQLAVFRTWKRWQAVLERACLVVAGRPAATRSPDAAGHHPDELPDVPHQWLAMPESPISSTAIRSMASAGAVPGALAALVPEAVAGYISTHFLYQQPS